MRRCGWWWAAILGVVGCSEEPTACGPWDEVFVYADVDGDGFGVEGVGWTCAPGAGEAIAAGDCDDDDGTSFPGGAELCDLADNDCNGAVDDGIALQTWYEDADGDTFGGRASEPSCAPPDPVWVAKG